jgi:hypothetical protein
MYGVYYNQDKEGEYEMSVKIKSWFLYKEFSQGERLIAEVSNAGDETVIVRETEKALLVKFHSDYGNVQKWVPKSCVC